jgi:hypothetical protein
MTNGVKVARARRDWRVRVAALGVFGAAVGGILVLPSASGTSPHPCPPQASTVHAAHSLHAAAARADSLYDHMRHEPTDPQKGPAASCT